MAKISTSECNNEVYEKGISVGLYDMPKTEAEEFCARLTEETGHLHDWHYIGGRVHVKALPTPMSEVEKEKVKMEGIWA